MEAKAGAEVGGKSFDLPDVAAWKRDSTVVKKPFLSTINELAEIEQQKRKLKVSSTAIHTPGVEGAGKARVDSSLGKGRNVVVKRRASQEKMARNPSGTLKRASAQI